MRKGWTQKKIKENAWGLKFVRWYLTAPSGNKYFFYKGAYFPRIYVPTTYDALAAKDKSEWCRKNDPTHELLRAFFASEKFKHDEYQQVLKFIYDIESKGGFSDQKRMNAWLDNCKEMQNLYQQEANSLSYNSMP